jgi:hypothetical protein
MESEIDKRGLFRYGIEWESATGLTLISNFDTGSLSIKLAY